MLPKHLLNKCALCFFALNMVYLSAFAGKGAGDADSATIIKTAQLDVQRFNPSKTDVKKFRQKIYKLNDDLLKPT